MWQVQTRLHGKTAQEVTQEIVDNVLSAVEHFVMENGKEFVADIAEAVRRLITYVHTTTTPNNPQATGNGKVDNQNKTLNHMLSMYVQGKTNALHGTTHWKYVSLVNGRRRKWYKR
jgi:hypothetical protein